MKVFISLGLIVGLGLAGWLAWTLILPPQVVIATPTKGPAVEAVYATGSVEPTVMVPIAARSGGRLIELLADEGQEVHKGDVLARLDDADLVNTINELQAKLAYAQTEFSRKEKLRAQGLVSQQSFDQARADFDAAGAAVARAAAQADYMKLISPADGRIIRRDGEIGQMIAANQTVFSLSCCAPLRLSAEVDEEDIARVTPGLAVLIRADAFPGQVFHGTVKSITPKGDAVTRSYRVRIELAPHTPLLIGMTAEANIILKETNDALLVPASALKGSTIQIVRDHKILEQQVESGARGKGQVEIRSGLTMTDTFNKTFNADLNPGQKVRSRVETESRP